MKKNKFIKSTLILVIGGLFTKVLGMLIKIVITRIIGTYGIGIYSLIIPTFMLLNTIAQFGLPTSLNILVSKNNLNNKKLVSTSIFISLIIDIIIFIILILFSKNIAINLLKEHKCILGLISIAFILPFISVSNMLRSYFFGKQRMYPHVITNVLEDIVRLILIILFLPYFLKFEINYAVAFIILTNIASELTSIIIFLYYYLTLKYIYNTNLGINYIKLLAPICLLHYIQSPISSSLQAMGKAKISLKGTFYGILIRTILLFTLSYLKIGIWGLILATSSNIIFVTLYDLYNVNKELKK